MFVVPLLSLVLTFTLHQGDVQPYFITKSKVWQGIDYKNGRSPFHFRLDEAKLDRTIGKVIVAMHAPDMSLGSIGDRRAESAAKRIVGKVDGLISEMTPSKVDRFTRDWLIAEGVCEFIRTNVAYDQTNRESTSNAETQIAHATYGYIFSEARPSAVCWGIAVCVRDLARAAGLHCDFVNGIYRWLGEAAPRQEDRNHGIVAFTFDGGIEIPADVSSLVCDYQNNHKPAPSRKTDSWMVLPRRPEAWEVFLATFNADVGEAIQISGDKQNQHKFLVIPYGEWADRNTAYLSPLVNWIRRNENQ